MGERRRVATQKRSERSVWRDESGKSSIHGVFALALVVGMVYFGMKVIPVRATAYQFDDAIRDEVVFAGGRRSSDEAIKRNLVDRAAMLGLPIERGDIRITRPAGKYIVVEVDYKVEVEFVGGYTYVWNFSPKHEGPLIF
ncbi:MAG: DUF4845 domain-containing protein [Acidobacteria bacterium]|nr:DUF4845 domain-containing protein [Acidobacteriota bacterium]